MSSLLGQLFFEHPAADDEILIYDEQDEVSAAQARAQAEALAEDLRDAGVRPGEPVMSQLPNSARAVIAMMAIWKVGAVFVPLNHRAPAAERERILTALPAAAVIDSSGVTALDNARQRFEPEVAFVTWTSGTTGPPKAILHTHESYLELLDRVLGAIRKKENSGGSALPPNLIAVPLALNSGIYNALFGLRAGRSLVIMDRFSSGRFAELVRRFQIASTVLPPAAIAMLAEDTEITDLAPLRFVRSITAPLAPETARVFHRRFGVFVLNSYGQAEVGEVIGWTAADARAFPEKVGAAGRPHAGVAIKIVAVDAEASPTPDGEIGQLLVRPPRMAVGYATGEDLGERFDSEGYLATGDLAYRDAEGFIWIAGRLGEVIVRGGNKIYPTEVEDVLRLSPSVADVAVVSVPDNRLGELPFACVVDAPGVAAATDAELVELCRAHLVAYKVPAGFRRVRSLPRNEIGKILRSELRREIVGEAG